MQRNSEIGTILVLGHRLGFLRYCEFETSKTITVLLLLDAKILIVSRDPMILIMMNQGVDCSKAICSLNHACSCSLTASVQVIVCLHDAIIVISVCIKFSFLIYLLMFLTF